MTHPHDSRVKKTAPKGVIPPGVLEEKPVYENIITFGDSAAHFYFKGGSRQALDKIHEQMKQMFKDRLGFVPYTEIQAGRFGEDEKGKITPGVQTITFSASEEQRRGFKQAALQIHAELKKPADESSAPTRPLRTHAARPSGPQQPPVAYGPL